jgi:site-specific recombinase XerD
VPNSRAFGEPSVVTINPDATAGASGAGCCSRCLPTPACGAQRCSGCIWDDIDLDRRIIRERDAKGGRQRAVPIYPGLLPPLVSYVVTRTPLGNRALFVEVQGHRLSATILAPTFRRSTSGIAERAHIAPHTLRYLFATELLSAGATVREIQELLAHNHLDSTPRYTRVNARRRGAIKATPVVTAR